MREIQRKLRHEGQSEHSEMLTILDLGDGYTRTHCMLISNYFFFPTTFFKS